MNRAFIYLLPLALVACALRQPGDFAAGDSSGATASGGETATSGGGPGTTTIAPELTTGAAATTGEVDATSTSTGSETSAPFIVPPDGGGCAKECDQWVQDCPPGQKCMPYSGDGDNSWESLKCVDVVPEPDGLDAQCMAFGSGVSGEDTCDVGLMCWGVEEDLVGTCVGLCIGSPDAPGCADPKATCLVAGDGVITLCLPQCDPLVQDCPAGERCVSDGYGFLCVEAVEEAQLFEPCLDFGSCAPGLQCVEPQGAVECDLQAQGCCVPFCDLKAENACPGEGQECVSWVDWPPPALAHVGICMVP
ncbi:hypothetical protein [Nannocystis sp. SCPEA4]|uniref:hypothetical protein n=1 Tax=Nannocystis sp. SCPEA4 TaxID=2996787 RepID=UPI00226F4DC1|nr:hypothetical protein [Nannocystis sp. SCPEA4]MCY1060930.1 hypothetical protein [Nannocystis sp. SCPEA4]